MLETAAEPEFLMADMSPEQLGSFVAYKAKLEVGLYFGLKRSLSVERNVKLLLLFFFGREC